MFQKRHLLVGTLGIFGLLLTGCMPSMSIEEMKAMMPKRPAELDRLNVFAGTWVGTGEATMMGVDKVLKSTATSEGHWEGDNWYIVVSSVMDMDEFVAATEDGHTPKATPDLTDPAQDHYDMVVEMVREISLQTDPQAMVSVFLKRPPRLYGEDQSVSLKHSLFLGSYVAGIDSALSYTVLGKCWRPTSGVRYPKPLCASRRLLALARSFHLHCLYQPEEHVAAPHPFHVVVVDDLNPSFHRTLSHRAVARRAHCPGVGVLVESSRAGTY